MPSTSDWNLYTWNTGTLQWDNEGTLIRPNEALTEETISNQQRTILANGDDAYMTPETYYTINAITFTWYLQSSTLKTQIETFIKNHEYIKITTHTSTVYIGRFLSIRPTWLTGQSPDKYDLECIFEIQEG